MIVNQVLVCSMADVRPLASLLKSLSFKSRATLKIDEIGLRMIVEEGRSIQAHAFISRSCFANYDFHLSPFSRSAYFDGEPPLKVRRAIERRKANKRRRRTTKANGDGNGKGKGKEREGGRNDDDDDYDEEEEEEEAEEDVERDQDRRDAGHGANENDDDLVELGQDGTLEDEDDGEEGTPPHAEMTISLSTMLECLNIFGNAGISSSSTNPFKKDHAGEGDGLDRDSESNRYKRRRRDWDDADERGDDGRGGGGRRGPRGGRDRGDGGGTEGKATSLRLSYKGVGNPLVMLLEENGIVTRCELTTYEPEGLLDLRFIDQERVQRLIIK
ncbi:hypothetical protein JCM10212_001941, partial [Sporobolomyces blumeae]